MVSRLPPMALALMCIGGCVPTENNSEPPAPLTLQEAERAPIQADIFDEGRLSQKIVRTAFAGLVRDGVANAPTSRASTANLLAAESNVRAQRAGFLPQASVSVGVNNRGQGGPVGQLRQLIYDGGQTSSRVRSAELQVDQVYENELAELSAQAFRAVETIINLRRDRARVSAARENTKDIRELLKDIESRFDAGVGSSADLLAGQGHLARAESDELEANADLANTQAEWTSVFGKISSTRLPAIPAAPKLGSASLDRIIYGSPRMRSALLASQIAQESVTGAQRARIPTLAATVETDFNQGLRQDPVSFQLGFDVPIYRGGGQRALVEQAQAVLNQTRAREEIMARSITEALTQARSEVATMAQRRASAKNSLSVNSKALIAATGQFQARKGSLLAVLDSQRSVNEARLSLIELEAEKQRAEYAVLSLTGDLLTAIGVTVPQRVSTWTQ